MKLQQSYNFLIEINQEQSNCYSIEQFNGAGKIYGGPKVNEKTTCRMEPQYIFHPGESRTEFIGQNFYW